MSRSTHLVATRSAALGAALLLVAGGLTACSSGSSTSSESASPATSATATESATTAEASVVTLKDGWVRSKEVLPSTATGMAADMTMTGAFGMLTNTTDKEVTITGGSSPAAGMVELHETVANEAGEMVMRPKEGGFVLPAKGTFELKPGGNHIMLMHMKSMPKIGTTVDITLETSAGPVKLTVPVRNFAGGDEKYVPATGGSASGASTPSSSMSH